MAEYLRLLIRRALSLGLKTTDLLGRLLTILVVVGVPVLGVVSARGAWRDVAEALLVIVVVVIIVLAGYHVWDDAERERVRLVSERSGPLRDEVLRVEPYEESFKPAGPQFENEWGLSIGFRVTNVSDHELAELSAILEEVDHKIDGLWRPFGEFEPPALPWSPGNRYEADLVPGGWRKCQLVRRDPLQGKYAELPVPETPMRLWPLPKGHYRLSVVIEVTGYIARRVVAEIRWSETPAPPDELLLVALSDSADRPTA